MTGSKKSKTPRPYLSYTQMRIWEKSPELYRQIYILGNIQEETAAMRLGKELAEALELNRESDISLINYAKIFLPAYPKREFELKHKINGIVMLGKLDGFDPKKRIIGEYKLGNTKWSQRMADKCDQLTFYETIYYFKYKRPANFLWLHHINLEGQIKSFITCRTMKDRYCLLYRVNNAWEGIKNLSKKFYE